jgi:hypothetical protein
MATPFLVFKNPTEIGFYSALRSNPNQDIFLKACEASF